MSAEAIGTFVAALALGVSAWSIFYLAKQTKAGTEQTKINNAVAAVSANDMVLRSLRDVHLLMLERPGSRAYFYADKPLPEQPENRDEIITIAELLADVMTSGIHVHESVPDSTSAGPWTDYCCQTLENSPVLRDLVRTHPTWWPLLVPLLPANTSP